MKNNDYKVEFEEHRKEIGLDRHDEEVLPSRLERHGSRRKKKASSHTTINVILGIFTFIPIFIFVYVIYNFYFGSDSGSAKVDNSDIGVEIRTKESLGNSEDPGIAIIDSEKEDEKQPDGKVDQSEGESTKTPVNVKPPTTEKQDKPKETEASKEEKSKTENKTENNTKARTHIVTANETLYRISMNYYGNDAGVEKIKQANGLLTNDIMAGQKLIIP